MRVLHVIPAIADRYGGPSQAVLQMCRATRALGVMAEIATTDADGPGRRMRLGDEQPCVYKDVPVWTFPRTCSERWKYSYRLRRWLDAHVAEYDLLHVHSVFSYATAAACRAARRRHVPVILRPCGMLAPYSLSLSSLRKGIYWRLIERHAVESASCLHATSPEERDELQRLVPRVDVRCIPLGLPQEAWSVPRQPGAFRERFGIAPDRPLLLFLSRLHRKKGLADLLLPALARLPAEVMLAVVGEDDPHDPAYARHCRSVAAQLGVERQIVFTGPIYAPDKWHVYDDAHLYILPSQHENFGITVIEAAARGTPGLFSPFVQAGRLLLDAGTGAVANNDVESLTAAIEGFLNRSLEERQAIGARAQEFTRRELSLDAMSRKLVDMYERVAGTGDR
ncbi:MAG TPA: glycosyltransferase [Candidatus Anammoximicrobium sp.]|nr:glycosyltransferase [Candidatus Anammoximicrobium sp.]